MSKILIATVGTRDVKLNTEFLNHTPPQLIDFKNTYCKKFNERYTDEILNPRDAGNYILKHYQTFKNYLNIPIIEPSLSYLQSADFLILVATNQPTPHINDTLYFAQIIKKIIQEKYNSSFPNIHVLEVNEDNVILLDKMYDYFATKFNQEPLYLINQCQELYLHLVGGIDAINSAIRLSCMYIHAEKLQPELHVDEKEAKVIPVKSFSRFLNAQQLLLARQLYKRYDYAAIYRLNSLNKNIKRLAEYAHHRLAFNFKKALEIIKNNKSIAVDIRKELIKQLEDINSSNKFNKEKHIQELYHNLFIKYQQENYVDFLVRIFRLYESLLLNDVLQISAIKYTEKNWEKHFLPYLEHNPELKAYLDNLVINEKPLQYNVAEPSTYLLLEILKYYKQQKIYEDEKIHFFEIIEKLKGLRNKSIGAHDFNPVSEEKILEKIKPFSIEQFFEQLKKHLSINDYPFEFINQKIEEEIQRSLTYS